MADAVNLYDGAYRNYGADLYEQVRVETYGTDLGQTSWVTQEESAEIPRLLGVSSDSAVLEIGCGSGAYALHGAENTGCRIVGVDINKNGIENANQLARARGLERRATFKQCDVSAPLDFKSGSFDAVFANDVLCHIPGRASLLKEIHRVLKPGGRMLFSDALVIGGMVSHEEIARRSSIGFYVFSPPGENEKLMQSAGLRLLTVSDTTEAAAGVARRWHDAREKRKEELTHAEGTKTFEGLQVFLHCVHTVMEERRLLRFLYVGSKEL
jgi:cyclopropane fatty-acyl-phospholipid synthase-like methyltransferase